MSSKKKKKSRGTSSSDVSSEDVPDLLEQFTAVNVPQSMTPRTGGNLTGPERRVKDLCADVHNAISKWTAANTKGGDIITKLANKKLKEIFKNESVIELTEEKLNKTCEFEELHALCDNLAKVYGSLEKVVIKMEGIVASLGGVCKLEWHQNNNAWAKQPLFKMWPTKQFYDTALELTNMYKKELDLKKTLMENVAHTESRDLIMFYASAWVHQPYIEPHADFLLECCLLETDHR